MLQTTLAELFERDLHKLQAELRLYPSDEAVWRLTGDIANSAGTLCLHLVGNLQHFIGATLGRTGYVRDRDQEFAARGIPRAELLAALDETSRIVCITLSQIDDRALDQTFPLQKHDQWVRTDHMLLHLFGHLSYHLGQVNYHRRLVALG